MRGLAPNLQEDFLQDIVGFGFFVHDVRDDRFQRFAVAAVKFFQRGLFSLGNRFHQRFVRSAGKTIGINKGTNHDLASELEILVAVFRFA